MSDISGVSDLYNQDFEVDISASSLELDAPEVQQLTKSPTPSQLTSTISQLPSSQPKKNPSVNLNLKSSSKKLVSSHKGLSKLFQMFKRTNDCFAEVIKTVSCYRVELGSTLDKIYITYNRLFELTLEKTIEIINKKQDEISGIRKHHEDVLGLEAHAKEDIQSKVQGLQNIIVSLKTQLRIAKTTEEALESEILQLREILKYDMGNTELMKAHLEKKHKKEDEESEEEEETNFKLHEVGPKHTQEVKEISEDPGLKLQLEELQDVMAQMEFEHGNKFGIITDMDGVLKDMIKSRTCKNFGTQVGDGELLWKLDPGAIIPVPNNPNCYFSLIKDVEGNSIPITRPRTEDEQKWSLTSNIMRFLANSPSRSASALPYPYFKKVLMEICLDRLSCGPELIGFMQPILQLDEFLCMYFLKKHQLRRLAEIKLKEFLSSLKYYMNKWQRAYVFSKVTGISGDVLDNEQYMYCDFHTQMYFLYCLGLLNSDSSCIWESNEGHTWLKNDKEEIYTTQLLPWIKKTEMRKVRQDISYFTRNLTDPNNQQGQFVDMDQILGFYLEEYIKARSKLLDRFKKNFSKRNQVQQGLFSYDEFRSMIDPAPKPDDNSSYPGAYAVARAYYFSLTPGQNSFEISMSSFLASCMRYGFDNPYPLVMIGLDLVFPYTNIKNMIDGKDDSRISGLLNKNKFSRESERSVSPDKANYLKVNQNRGPAVRQLDDAGTITQAPSIERTAALLAQHYSIIRELKRYSDQFKQLVTQKAEYDAIMAAFERLSIILANACEFFAFPVTF